MGAANVGGIAGPGQKMCCHYITRTPGARWCTSQAREARLPSQACTNSITVASAGTSWPMVDKTASPQRRNTFKRNHAARANRDRHRRTVLSGGDSGCLLAPPTTFDSITCQLRGR